MRLHSACVVRTLVYDDFDSKFYCDAYEWNCDYFSSFAGMEGTMADLRPIVTVNPTVTYTSEFYCDAYEWNCHYFSSFAGMDGTMADLRRERDVLTERVRAVMEENRMLRGTIKDVSGHVEATRAGRDVVGQARSRCVCVCVCV